MNHGERALIRRAAAIAEDAHFDQQDKLGLPYIFHPITVAGMVGPDIDAIIVALLHDVIEDTPYSLEHLKTHNFSSEVLAALDAITHRKGETRMAYYERVAANPLALKVKRADIAHNTSEARLKYLDEATRTRLVEKYRVAVETLDRLSGGQNTP